MNALTLDEVGVAPEDAAQVIYDLRRRIRNAEEYIANVVEDCYQPDRLRCQACDSSLGLALAILRGGSR